MDKSKKSILALLGIAIVCAIAVPAIIGESPPEDFVTTNTSSQITTLGSNATYLITVKNIGNETDVYNITAINVDNASVAVLNQTEISIDSGQSGNVSLNVSDTDVIGPYCVMVNATSQVDAGLTDEVETITAVVEDEEEE
jgi:hypothetical protein